MKNILRASALTCAVLAVVCGAPLSSAHAADNGDLVRMAQMRLAELGYPAGRDDGVMGPLTQEALMDFQRHSGLPATGALTAETYDRLMHVDYAAYHTMSPLIYADYQGITADRVISQAPVLWDNRWQYIHTQELPLRYGKLDVSENDMGTLRHYIVTLNGRAVLLADNQPGLLRVSRTFQLDNQDAVIFTAYAGDGACSYKNYLLTVHGDGSFNMPREIGNCAGNFEAHVADNALFVSFPNDVRLSIDGFGLTGVSTWDVWRYENDQLARI